MGENYDYGSTSSITNCYSTGSITSSSSSSFSFSYIGGLAGDFYGNITDSYSTGSVASDCNSYDSTIGGLVGHYGNGTITNCYSTGSVTSLNSTAGGLAGVSFNANIEKCYSSGHVLATGFMVNKGGFLGYSGSGTFTACFWDTNTSGLAASAGGAGVQGRTTAEMKTLSTFTSAGWDFVWETANGTNDIWAICEGGELSETCVAIHSRRFG